MLYMKDLRWSFLLLRDEQSYEVEKPESGLNLTPTYFAILCLQSNKHEQKLLNIILFVYCYEYEGH